MVQSNGKGMLMKGGRKMKLRKEYWKNKGVRESFNLKKGEEERVGRLSVGRTNKGNGKEYVRSKGIREKWVGVERG